MPGSLTVGAWLYISVQPEAVIAARVPLASCAWIAYSASPATTPAGAVGTAADPLVLVTAEAERNATATRAAPPTR